jgi:hypothetical protein
VFSMKAAFMMGSDQLEMDCLLLEPKRVNHEMHETHEKEGGNRTRGINLAAQFNRGRRPQVSGVFVSFRVFRG